MKFLPAGPNSHWVRTSRWSPPSSRSACSAAHFVFPYTESGFAGSSSRYGREEAPSKM